MPDDNPVAQPAETPTVPETTKTAGKSAPVSPLPKKRFPIKLILIGVVVLVILFFGIPWIIRSFNTVSTDDAYVNSYVTFVAPRVTGQVLGVLVEDNNRVKKGDVLVQLDPEPSRLQCRGGERPQLTRPGAQPKIQARTRC
jgi:membrane fusion protein (multidrug efflux system)